MKKFLIGAGTLSAGAVMVLSSFAFAQTSTTTTSTATTPQAPKVEMVLQVGPRGNVTMRGTLQSVGAGSLTVSSWGGTWTVNVPSSTEIMPAAAGNDLSQFKQGDFVGVQGTVSQSGSWTIDAKIVRDWTYRGLIKAEAKQNEQAAREIMKSNTPRNFVGTASNGGASSLTLTVNGTALTVNILSNAQVVNRNWLTISPTAIQNGDNVRVWGVNASGTVSASIVRDVSLPAMTSTTSTQH